MSIGVPTARTARTTPAPPARGTATRESAGGTGRPTAPWTGVVELAAIALTVAAAIDLARLFRHAGGFLGPVLAVSLGVHAICWWCRRRGLGLGVSAVLAAAAVALLSAWTILPHHLVAGVPGAATVRDARVALDDAVTRFRSTAVPTSVVAGFTLAGALGCGIAAFLADWAAFRMAATVEAVVPSLSLFVFSAALAQGHGAMLATGVWLAAFLCFLAARESGAERPDLAWFASRAGRGPGAVLRAGAALAAVLVLATTAVGPHLPGATVHPLVAWRQTGNAPHGRTTESPLVDLRARLREEPGVEVFTVKTPVPAYWRITALDTFDGNGWSLDNTYRHAGSNLSSPTMNGQPLTAHFTIATLSSIWLPAAFKPLVYKGPGHVSYSADADSLVIDSGTSDGLNYAVSSSVPTPTPDMLRASPPAVNDPAVAHYLDLPRLPADVLALVVADLRQATAGAATPYDRALRLENWFRTTFTYDLDVPPDDGDNAIRAFLTVRRGFCQQFAGTFAVMARLLGLPTRVAVGFTPGVPAADGLLHVRDQQAHAWPEVWFEGLGWVPFEPTPGRGAPQEQIYTGIPPQQDTGGGSPTPVAPAVTTPSTVPAASSPPTTAPNATRTSPPSTSRRHRRGWSGLASALAMLAAWLSPLALLALIPAARHLRRAARRRAARTPAARVQLAWEEAGADLARLGLAPRAADTPAEVAARAAGATLLGAGARAAVSGLAERVVATSYAEIAVDDELAAGAEAERDVIGRAAGAARGWRGRLTDALDPRPLVRARSR